MKRIVLSLTCTPALLISFAMLLASADKQLFSLNISTPSDPMKAGAELRLHVKVTNTSDRSIAFIRSISRLHPRGDIRF